MTAPHRGSRSELAEVLDLDLDLARAGSVEVHVETYTLDQAPLVCQRLHAGRINGRAVILTHG